MPSPLLETGREPRSPVLLLVAQRHLLSLSIRPVKLQGAVGFQGLPWGTRCTLQVVRDVLRLNESLLGRIEHEPRELEELAADESPQSFFETTFRLKRSIVLARGDLWRLRGLRHARRWAAAVTRPRG
jgi:hypothetical protein